MPDKMLLDGKRTMSTRHMERKQQTWAILRMRGMMEGRWCVWNGMGWMNGENDSREVVRAFFLSVNNQTSRTGKKNENPPVGRQRVKAGERVQSKSRGRGEPAGLF